MGVPIRLRRVFPIRSFSAASGFAIIRGLLVFIGVSMGPGRMQLTLMLRGAYSFARAVVIARMPPFEAVYATRSAAPLIALTELVLTMTPPPLSLMLWAANLQPKN